MPAGPARDTSESILGVALHAKCQAEVRQLYEKRKAIIREPLCREMKADPIFIR